MFELNRVLIQLDKAITLAASALPQERDLAVIMLDSLVEIQLYKGIELTFAPEDKRWYRGKRSYNKRSRTQALQDFEQLLSLAVQSALISKEESALLAYARDIRNELYPGSTEIGKKRDLALLIYYRLFVTNPRILRLNAGISQMEAPGYEQIDFGQGADIQKSRYTNKGKPATTDFPAYFEKAFRHLLKKWIQPERMTEPLRRYLLEQVEATQWRLQQINYYSQHVNFYEVLNGYWYLNDYFSTLVQKDVWPKDMDSILLLFRYLRLYKAELDSIDDLKSRQRRGATYYKSIRHEFRRKYPSWTDLDQVKQRLQVAARHHGIEGIKSLLYIAVDIREFTADVELANYELEEFLLHLADMAKW